MKHYTIEAYDHIAWSAAACIYSKSLNAARRYAKESLIHKWANVEIRMIDPVTENGIVIEAWENGEPVEVDKRAFV